MAGAACLSGIEWACSFTSVSLSSATSARTHARREAIAQDLADGFADSSTVNRWVWLCVAPNGVGGDEGLNADFASLKLTPAGCARNMNAPVMPESMFGRFCLVGSVADSLSVLWYE